MMGQYEKFSVISLIDYCIFEVKLTVIEERTENENEKEKETRIKIK